MERPSHGMRNHNEIQQQEDFVTETFEQDADGTHNDNPQDRTSDSNNGKIRKFTNNMSLAVIDSKGIETGMSNWRLFSTIKKIDRKRATMIQTLSAWPKKQLFEYTIWTFFALAIQFILGGGTGGWAFTNDSVPTCDEDDTSKNLRMCDLHESLVKGSSQFIVLAAFILGGFLASSVGLWLRRRSNYANHCGATRNLLINICSIIQDTKMKKLLSRWTSLAFELTVLKARGIMDSEEGEDYLDDLLLLKSSEWESMVPEERCSTVWFWIQAKAAALARDGLIKQFEFQTICNAVMHSRDRANDLMACLSNDQPPPYVLVCGFLVNIHLLAHTVATGVRWAIWTHDAAGGETDWISWLNVWTHPKMFVEIVTLFLYTTIYAMLFDVCSILYNPFGPRNVDIEHYKIGGKIREFAKELSRNTYSEVLFKNNNSDNSICTTASKTKPTGLGDNDSISENSDGDSDSITPIYDLSGSDLTMLTKKNGRSTTSSTSGKTNIEGLVSRSSMDRKKKLEKRVTFRRSVSTNC